MTEQILVIAAHPDDEALGCGGTIRKFSSEGSVVHILFVCDGIGARNPENYARQKELLEKRREMARKAAVILGAQPPVFLDFPDNRMDSVDLLDVVQAIEAVIERIQPQVILTHHCGDLNIDHELTARAVLTACRPQPEYCVEKIYAFEVLSSTEWANPAVLVPFIPHHFVNIANTLPQKLTALSEAYGTEMRSFPHSRSIESVTANALLRGTSCGLEAAEAFMVLRSMTR